MLACHGPEYHFSVQTLEACTVAVVAVVVVVVVVVAVVAVVVAVVVCRGRRRSCCRGGSVQAVRAHNSRLG